jgi:glycosyltransferase involved in cell wall biosynthesis
MNISICTQLLDWNFAFKYAFPTWLKFPCDEIIVFDWGCGKESAYDVIKQYNDSRIKFIKGIDNIPYNFSIARNIAIKAAKNDLIFFVDSDVKILNNIPIELIKPNDFMQGCPLIGTPEPNEKIYKYNLMGKYLGLYKNSLSGTCIFWKKHFEQINGYHEFMRGWGFDDEDFYTRLIKLGINRIDFPNNLLQHIHHNDNDRVKNFRIKNYGISDTYNKKISNMFNWSNKYQHKKMKVIIYNQEEKFL